MEKQNKHYIAHVSVIKKLSIGVGTFVELPTDSIFIVKHKPIIGENSKEHLELSIVYPERFANESFYYENKHLGKRYYLDNYVITDLKSIEINDTTDLNKVYQEALKKRVEQNKKLTSKRVDNIIKKVLEYSKREKEAVRDKKFKKCMSNKM